MRRPMVTTPVYHRDFSESLIFKVNAKFQALSRAAGGESGSRTHDRGDELVSGQKQAIALRLVG